MRQPHEKGQVLIEEHFPALPGFLEPKELRQFVVFPGPLEPAKETAPGPALQAFLATALPELHHHSHL